MDPANLMGRRPFAFARDGNNGMGEAPPCVNTDLGDSRWLVATDPLGNGKVEGY